MSIIIGIRNNEKSLPEEGVRVRVLEGVKEFCDGPQLDVGCNNIFMRFHTFLFLPFPLFAFS